MPYRRGKTPDDLDFALLAALRQDPRLPNNALGKLLNVTHVTVRQRIARLIEDGYIRIAPVVDPHTFGFDREIELLLKVQPDLTVSLAESLAGHAAVRRVELVMGSADILVNAVFRDEQHLLAFVRLVTATPGIRELQTHQVIRTFKTETDWDPPANAEVSEQSNGIDDDLWQSGGISLESSALARIQLATHWLSASVEGNSAVLSQLSSDDIVYETTLYGRRVGKQAVLEVVDTFHREFGKMSARIFGAAQAEVENSVVIRWAVTLVRADKDIRQMLHTTTVTIEHGLVSSVRDKQGGLVGGA